MLFNLIDINKIILMKLIEFDLLLLWNKLSGSVWDVGSIGYLVWCYVFNWVILYFLYVIVVFELDVDIINIIDYVNCFNL